MHRPNPLFALVAFLGSACASNQRAPDPSLQLARELDTLDTTAFEAPQRVRAEPPAARVDPARVPVRPTGTSLSCRYVLHSGTASVEYVFERDASRLRVLGNGEEWFFERNPIAPEQLTGLRVDAPRRTLVEFPHTDLRIDGYAEDWSSLARLGVAPGELAKLRRTGEVQDALGLRFERYVAEGDAPWREVLWSELHQIPLRALRADGVTLELIGLELYRAGAGVASARESYPHFLVRDIADWREFVHDHEHAHNHDH